MDGLKEKHIETETTCDDIMINGLNTNNFKLGSDDLNLRNRCIFGFF